MAKWAYDWGVPVPVLKLILLAVAAIVLVAVFNLVKKAVVITVIAALVLIGLNALGIYQMKTDPKELVGQVSELAEEKSDTIIAGTMDLFYQSQAYVKAVEPVETLKTTVAGENAFWYLLPKDTEIDLSQEIFKGYKINDTREAGEFKAYYLKKS